MPMSEAHAPRHVRTSLNYFRALDDRSPYVYVHDPPAGIAQENLGTEPYSVQINDARGQESEFALDSAGFQFVNHASIECDFNDEDRIRTAYYREVEDLLKREAGAKRVHIFDHTIRSALDCYGFRF